jgi:hypothetical protein
MDAKKLIGLIEEAGYEARSYSGRGMYGRQCVGAELERSMSAFTFALELTRAALDSATSEDPAGEVYELIDQLTQLRTSSDSMGLDTILYFPDVKWEKPEDDTDEDDEEADDYQDEAELS